MRFNPLRHHWPLALVAIVAVALRWPGVELGLPFATDPDEPTNLTRILLMIQQGDANPHWFHYPSLLFYVNAGALITYGTARDLIASASLPEMTVFGTGVIPDLWTLMVPRITTLVVSVLTVVVIYVTVHRVTGRRWAATFAGALMALSPIAIAHGALFTPDPLSALFSAAVVWAAVRVYEHGSAADYFLAGVAVGFATGSKYNAAFMSVAIFAAHVLRRRRGGETWPRGLLTAIYVSAGVFLLTTPFAILDSSTFLSDIGFELVHYSTGHAGAVGGFGAYLPHILWTFSVALALPTVGLRDERYRPYLIMTLVAGVGYTAFLSVFPTTFLRNLLPALPPLAIAVGIGGASVARSYEKSGVVRALIGVTVLGSLLIAATAPGIQLDGRTDRAEAREWLAENIPDGSKVVVEWMTPWIDPDRVEVVAVDFVVHQSLPSNWDYVILSDPGSIRFKALESLYPGEAANYDTLAASSCLVEEFPGVAEIRSAEC